VRFETLFEVGHGLDVGGGRTEEELWARAKITSPLGSLEQVLSRFELTQRAFCSTDAVRRIAFENVEDCFRDGVVLAELRFSPASMAQGKDLALDAIIEAVLQGVDEAVARYPIRVGLIGIVSRNMAAQANCRAADALIRAAAAGGRRLCGFDLAASEREIAPEPFMPLVERGHHGPLRRGHLRRARAPGSGALPPRQDRSRHPRVGRPGSGGGDLASRDPAGDLDHLQLDHRLGRPAARAGPQAGWNSAASPRRVHEQH
jgi:hypothetical protein